MPVQHDDDLTRYAQDLGQSARRAAESLAIVDAQRKSDVLERIAALIRESVPQLLEANRCDVAAAEAAGLARPLVERLKLDQKRIASMADGIAQIAQQPDPLGETIESRTRPDGLRIEKRRVPLGVVLFLYESRPNVTADAAGLCIRSGNAVILRGGKEAMQSNRAIVTLIQRALGESSLDPRCVQFVDSTDRGLVPHLLRLDRHVDLVIPRGGESLIRAVVAESTIPVLKHFTGNCHIYIDASAREMDEKVVRDICVNAKTSYPGGAVCNAVEHILVHREAMEQIPGICDDLAARGVEIRGDEHVRKLYMAARAATPQDWATEYLSLIVGIKLVESIDEAIAHINEFGSRHTDAIISRSPEAIDQFVARVDSASIMVNASTRLADGGEYGLGAEIGISTDKLHARGPMGAADLTTYKWVVTGAGHVRG